MLFLTGSRNLGSAYKEPVHSILDSLDGKIITGCATGLDSFVLSWAIHSGNENRVTCHAAFGPDEEGICQYSNWRLVRKFAQNGGKVIWATVSGSIAKKLHARTIRAATGALRAGGQCLAFFASQNSTGTLLAVKTFANANGEIFGLPCGIDRLPNLGFGDWAPANHHSLPQEAFRWIPDPGLF